MELEILEMLLVKVDDIVDDEPMRLAEMNSSRRLRLIAPMKDVK